MSCLPINRIMERRIYIKNHLNKMILSDISNLISEYDWEFNGNSYVLGEHTGSVFCIVVLSDARIVSGSSDGEIKVWNLETNKCECTIFNYSNINPNTNMKLIYCIAMLPTLQTDQTNHTSNKIPERIITGSGDHIIRIWNLVTRVCDSTFIGHKKSITCIHPLSDGRLASGSLDGTIKIWNIETCICDFTFNCEQGPILCFTTINISKTNTSYNNFQSQEIDNTKKNNKQNPRMIISKGRDQTIKIWNLQTYKCEKTFNNIHSCDKKCHVAFQSCIINANNKIIFFGSCDGTIKKIKIDNIFVQSNNLIDEKINLSDVGKCIRSICALSDDRLLSCNSNMIKIWNTITKKCEKIFLNDSNAYFMTCVKLHDGRFVTGSTDKKIKIWS